MDAKESFGRLFTGVNEQLENLSLEVENRLIDILAGRSRGRLTLDPNEQNRVLRHLLRRRSLRIYGLSFDLLDRNLDELAASYRGSGQVFELLSKGLPKVIHAVRTADAIHESECIFAAAREHRPIQDLLEQATTKAIAPSAPVTGTILLPDATTLRMNFPADVPRTSDLKHFRDTGYHLLDHLRSVRPRGGIDRSTTVRFEGEPRGWGFIESATPGGPTPPLPPPPTHSDTQVKSVEPPPRYADLTLNQGRSGERTARLLSGEAPLRIDQWYTIEVAIREKPQGLPATGPRPPIREPRQNSDVKIYVTADPDGFEVEEPVRHLVLPPRGDSSENAEFHVKPVRVSSGSHDLARVEFRFFYKLNLLEVVRLRAQVVGKFASEDLLPGVERGAIIEPVRHEQDYVDFDDVRPRQLHIDVTPGGSATEYKLTFTFAGPGTEVALSGSVRLGSNDLEQKLTDVRNQLLDVVTSESFQHQVDVADSMKEFRALAKRGRALWSALFPADQSAMAEIERFLRENPLELGSLVQISMDRSLSHFVQAWNLLYEKQIPLDEDAPIDPEAFWGLRYVIEQRLPSVRAVTDRSTVPGTNVEVSMFSWHFPQTTGQLSFLQQLAKDKANVPHIDTRNAAFKHLNSCQCAVLYFFSHGHTRAPHGYGNVQAHAVWLKRFEELPAASEERQQFQDVYESIKQATIDSLDSWIQLRVGRIYREDLEEEERLQLKSRPIVFLNMCESAQVTPSFSKSFIEIFLRRGARGVIGTECSMNPFFADHFARAFLPRLLGGDPVGRALLDVRREFASRGNPLGLAYTLFGLATSRFEPPIVVRETTEALERTT